MQRNLIETPAYSESNFSNLTPGPFNAAKTGPGGDGFLLPNFLVLSTYVDAGVSLLEPPSSDVCLTLGDLARGTLQGDCPRGVVDEETTTVGILEGRGRGREEMIQKW